MVDVDEVTSVLDHEFALLSVTCRHDASTLLWKCLYFDPNSHIIILLQLRDDSVGFFFKKFTCSFTIRPAKKV